MPKYLDTLYDAFYVPSDAEECRRDVAFFTTDKNEALKLLWPVVDAQPDDRASHKALFHLLEACEHLSDVYGRMAFASGLRLGIRIGESFSEAEGPESPI